MYVKKQALYTRIAAVIVPSSNTIIDMFFFYRWDERFEFNRNTNCIVFNAVVYMYRDVHTVDGVSFNPPPSGQKKIDVKLMGVFILYLL